MLSTLPLLLMTGCSTEQVDVYLFLLGQQETLSETTTLTHNFSDAYEPSDADDWTRSDDGQISSQATFGELVTMADGSALLQLGTQTYPGTGDKGAWTFEWEDFDRGQTANTHTAGYTYTTDYENSRLDTLSLTEGTDAGTLSGTWTTTTLNSLDQAEDDTWSLDVGLPIGQIVVGGLLLIDDGVTGERPASNTGQETDCSGSPCLLATSTTVETFRVIQGILTEYTPEDLERDSTDYGQNEGYQTGP
jgi:hypothetical protein